MGSESSPLLKEWVLSCPLPELIEECRTRTESESDALLWLRCRHDRVAFALMLWPEVFTLRFSSMHLDMLSVEKTEWRFRRERTFESTAAPRNAGKSMIESLIELAHDIVYGIEAFIGVATKSRPLADRIVATLFELFKDPDACPELHRMYGPFTVKNTKTDFIAVSPSAGNREGTRVMATSMRSGAIRGVKHNFWRVTKWVLDDIEDEIRAKKPENRDEDEAFLDNTIVQAGDRRYTRICFIGTYVEPDSVLARKQRPGTRWAKRFYQAIVSWPDELDGLWQQLRQIYQDVDLGGPEERRKAARAFYIANGKAMDAGAEVLWPEGRPLFELMLEYFDNPIGFMAEQQNAPGLSEDRTFQVDDFKRVGFDGREILTDTGRAIPLSRCRLQLWWDPIPYGKRSTGRDEAAFALLAKCDHGGIYVLEVVMTKAPPQRQWDILFGFMERFPAARFDYENNQGTVEENPEFAKQLAEVRKRFPQIRFQGHQSQGNKEARIANMQPATESGAVRFARGLPGKLFDQARYFPHGRNDDGLDAVERAYNRLNTSTVRTVRRRSY